MLALTTIKATTFGLLIDFSVNPEVIILITEVLDAENIKVAIQIRAPISVLAKINRCHPTDPTRSVQKKTRGKKTTTYALPVENLAIELTFAQTRQKTNLLDEGLHFIQKSEGGLLLL